MSDDRDLIDTIKSNFAHKSSAQLRDILHGDDKDRWSPEAIQAADEVLQDRLAGRGEEPLTPEEDRPPPRWPFNPYSLGFLVLGGLLGPLAGIHVTKIYRRSYEDTPEPDVPLPFGPKMAWLALDTTDTGAVATCLGLKEARTATWAEGVATAQQGAIFVTPPLGDWTLALGTSLFPPDRAEDFVKPLLVLLSRQFGDVQYFCSHADVNLHVWARAAKGRLLRGFGWLGSRNLVLWDEGGQTEEEVQLGFRSTAAGPSLDEAAVMQLACLWSVDPTTLNEQFGEPSMGILGNLPSTESRAGQ